jgi:hypothetical protein
MSTNVMRVEFDSTVDEVVDANMRLQHTTTYQEQRKQYQWACGICAAGGLAVNLLGRSAVPSYGQVALAALAAPIVGFVCGQLYRRYHDWWARRGYRRVVQELCGSDAIHCECELREQGLWTKAMQTETLSPWSRLTRVEDAHESVELWFSPGLVVVRDKAFQTADERRSFLDVVRGHLNKGS